MGTRRRFGMSVLLVACVVIGGSALLFAAAKGSSNVIESTCQGDSMSRPGDGAYSIAAETWPPSIDCIAQGNEVPPVTIGHPVMAWLLAGMLVTLAALVLATAAIAAWWCLFRVPVERPGPGRAPPTTTGRTGGGRASARHGRLDTPARRAD